jgi:DNA mismatch repair protein MutL
MNFIMPNTQIENNIKELSDILISRIAAGEVIERPASVIKELVENSLDAKATNIIVNISDGGRNSITITDNGFGIDKRNLLLALKRHATSKISNNNLLEITSFGFRGEGLASIASIAKLTLTSRHQNSQQAYQITNKGGVNGEINPANLAKGTIINVQDLFYATPARLKFLKSERSENSFVTELVKKFAIANPQASFKLIINDKEILHYHIGDAKHRLSEIFGKEFLKNSLPVNYDNHDYKIHGYISLPTYNRANNAMQYSFINSRLVKDKIILHATKIAYQDYLSKDRYPIIILFVDLPHLEIDVNVHPTKSEIRFRDNQKIRNILIKSLKNALQQAAFKAAPKIGEGIIAKFDTSIAHNNIVYQRSNNSYTKSNFATPPNSNSFNSNIQDNLSFSHNDFAPAKENIDPANILPNNQDYPLGCAIAQLHETYIISQTKNGLIITDQHAAHERLLYEKTKELLKNKNVMRQTHLFSEIVELEALNLENLLSYQEKLLDYGVKIEKFGSKGIIVKETPEIFKEINIKTFIKDLADNISEYGEALNLNEKFTEIYGNHACKNAIKAGRRLNISDMNQILRDMEQTPFSGQCNHGRPTYVELKKSDLEKLFGRT